MPIIYIDAGSLSIVQGKIEDFESQFLYASSCSSLVINSLLVQNNRWYSSYLSTAGMVYIEASKTSISNSTFKNLVANTGPAITAIGLSVIINESYLQIKNSSFSNNTALFGGGAIYVEDVQSLMITATSFSGNTALSDNGGSLYLSCSKSQCKPL